MNDKTKLINFSDNELWDLNVLIDIKSKVEKYILDNKYNNAYINEIENSTWTDPINQRYDIWITYIKNKKLFQQKLLYLKGELLDGNEFHKRYEEFYPCRCIEKGA